MDEKWRTPPLICRVESKFGKSPSAIFAGCSLGVIPGPKCANCPAYSGIGSILPEEKRTVKIIKHGSPKYNKPDRRFKCGNCGCVFEAEYGEYKTVSQYNETYRYCTCPECGKSANEVLTHG